MTEPSLSPDLAAALKKEARARDQSVEALLGSLTPEAGAAPKIFSCPEETCAFRSWTLAQVCPDHGVHVV